MEPETMRSVGGHQLAEPAEANTLLYGLAQEAQKRYRGCVVAFGARGG